MSGHVSFRVSFFLSGRGCTAVDDGVFSSDLLLLCFTLSSFLLFLSVRWGVALQLSLFDSFFLFG